MLRDILLGQGGAWSGRNPVEIYRGLDNGRFTVPLHIGYLFLRDVCGREGVMPGGLDQVPVMFADGTTVEHYWNVGETKFVGAGCGDGRDIILGGQGDCLVSIWGTPTQAEDRTEAYEDSPRGRA